MSPLSLAYGMLAVAIISEVIGSSCLQLSAQFTKPVPTVAMVFFYVTSIYSLSQALKTIPLGTAYAIWCGCGIILTAMVSVYVFRFALDAAAIVGIAMIIAGIAVMNLFSRSVTH